LNELLGPRERGGYVMRPVFLEKCRRDAREHPSRGGLPEHPASLSLAKPLPT